MRPTDRLLELYTRWDYQISALRHGMRRRFRFDQSKTPLFGASNVRADVMCRIAVLWAAYCALRAGASPARITAASSCTASSATS